MSNTNRHPKTKTIELCGHEYHIAPLTMRQIEELIEGDRSAESIPETRQRLWLQIHTSLKNASPAEAPSIEEMRDRLDLADYLELLKQVREISNLVILS